MWFIIGLSSGHIQLYTVQWHQCSKINPDREVQELGVGKAQTSLRKDEDGDREIGATGPAFQHGTQWQFRV